MKKNFLACAATCLAVLAITHTGYSQKSSRAIVYNKTVDPSSSSSTNADLNGVSVDYIAAKALKDFNKSFGNASAAKWYIVNAGYTTKFTQNEIQYRVDYDKKGNWTGTMKSYDEKKLPPDVRATVKSVYYDYSIKWVKEITVPNYPNVIVYMIHIDDEKSFKNLQVIDGEILVLEAYDKQ